MSPSPSSFALVATDLVKAFGPHTVLDGVSVSVGPATRLGVVGPNGAGKSTLLRLLAGVDRPDRGKVAASPADLRVGYLPQEPDREGAETVLDVLARRTGVATAEADLDDATRAMADGRAGADALYAGALDRYLASGAPDFEARAAAVCDELGLGTDRLPVRAAELSGGQAARMSLASILLSRYDVLLLDEPTNDLDFAGLARLEQFVESVAGGVVIVSHDRAFLERTISSVLELDEHSRAAAEYAGGFAAYLEARAVARRHAEEDFATYTAERSCLQDRARRQRQWAVQGAAKAKRDPNVRDKFIRQFRVNSSEHVAAKARATEQAMARLDPVEKPWEGWELRMEIASAPRSGAVVAELRDAVVERGGFTLGPVDLIVHWAERVAITGANGAGKTTLLQTLLGHLPLTAGEQRVGPGVVVGEMDQLRQAFGADDALLDVFLRSTGLVPSDARSQLAKFGLTAEHVTRPASSLSPGERTRAVLAGFSARGVNCLVLDEPTNHLDLPAIDQLEQALEQYDGTLLLVSHDRRLLDAVRVTRSVEIRAGLVGEDRETTPTV